MATQSRFIIRNDRLKPVALVIEPEGVVFPLGAGQEVSITDGFTKAPVTLFVSGKDDEAPIISIWPGDGDVRVEKDGMNVFDLI